MRSILLAAILMLAVFLFTACSSQIRNREEEGTMKTKAVSYVKISPKEAKARLEQDKDIILLDVRTPEEYTERHIPGSMLIPVDVIGKEAPDKLADKEAPIFVYCRSGRRSAAAAQELVRMGYTDVYDLGGILDWPYETESGK